MGGREGGRDDRKLKCGMACFGVGSVRKKTRVLGNDEYVGKP